MSLGRLVTVSSIITLKFHTTEFVPDTPEQQRLWTSVMTCHRVLQKYAEQWSGKPDSVFKANICRAVSAIVSLRVVVIKLHEERAASRRLLSATLDIYLNAVCTTLLSI